MTTFGLVVDHLDSDESKKLWDTANKAFSNCILLDDLSQLLIALKYLSMPLQHEE